MLNKADLFCAQSAKNSETLELKYLERVFTTIFVDLKGNSLYGH